MDKEIIPFILRVCHFVAFDNSCIFVASWKNNFTVHYWENVCNYLLPTLFMVFDIGYCKDKVFCSLAVNLYKSWSFLLRYVYGKLYVMVNKKIKVYCHFWVEI